MHGPLPRPTSSYIACPFNLQIKKVFKGLGRNFYHYSISKLVEMSEDGTIIPRKPENKKSKVSGLSNQDSFA